MSFLLYSVNVMDHIDLFSNIKPTLHFWNRLDLLYITHFMYYWIQIVILEEGNMRVIGKLWFFIMSWFNTKCIFKNFFCILSVRKPYPSTGLLLWLKKKKKKTVLKEQQQRKTFTNPKVTLASITDRKDENSYQFLKNYLLRP